MYDCGGRKGFSNKEGSIILFSNLKNMVYHIFPNKFTVLFRVESLITHKSYLSRSLRLRVRVCERASSRSTASCY